METYQLETTKDHGKVSDFNYFSEDNIDLKILNKILDIHNLSPIEVRDKLENEYCINQRITVSNVKICPRDDPNRDNEFFHEFFVTVIYISNYLNIVAYQAECTIILCDVPNKMTNYEYFNLFNTEDEDLDIEYFALFSTLFIKKYVKNKVQLPDDIIDHIKSYNFDHSNYSKLINVLDNYRS